MLTQEPTPAMKKEWEYVWHTCKDVIKPNRKSGQELMDHLKEKYVLTEIFEKEAADTVSGNVMLNRHFSEKMPSGASPLPKTFFVENRGAGEIFYKKENRSLDCLRKNLSSRIFVGIDLISGYFMVEGSSLLWDELCAFQGLDEADLQNAFCIAQYVACIERFGNLDDLSTR